MLAIIIAKKVMIDNQKKIADAKDLAIMLAIAWGSTITVNNNKNTKVKSASIFSAIIDLFLISIHLVLLF